MLIFFVACRRQQSVSTPLNAAERILKDNPDSAFRIIQSIPYPDKQKQTELARCQRWRLCHQYQGSKG